MVNVCVINWSDSRIVRHAFSQTPNYDADASILLNDLGWKNLETQRQIQKAVMVYKSLNCLAPDYMSSKFILRSDLFNSYNLRDSENKLAVPLPRTITIEIAFATAGLFCGTICPLMLDKKMFDLLS